MKTIIAIALLVMIDGVSEVEAASVVDELLAEYRVAGATEFDAARGERMWSDTSIGGEHSCATCHSNDLRNAGKHKKTGKRIEPLAPSVNAERLTERKQIEKWFKRNCKWTWGRECTPQEKGDFLSFIRTR